MLLFSPSHKSRRPGDNTGSALLLGVIILVALSLLAVFASSSGIMQERMTGNFRDDARSFEAAETGLRWVEAWIAAIRNPSLQPVFCDPLALIEPSSGNDSGDGDSDGTAIPACDSSDIDTNAALGDVINQVGLATDKYIADRDNAWWQSNGMAFGTDPRNGVSVTAAGTFELDAAIPGVAEQPRLLLEHHYFERDGLEMGGEPTGIHFYRITSRATGGNPNNVTILESTFAKRYQ